MAVLARGGAPPEPPAHGGPARPPVPPWPPRSFRAFRCWLTRYRRIWRSSVWSSVLGPVFYLGAMGFGLGTLVDRHGTPSLRGGGRPALLPPAPPPPRRVRPATG